MWIGRLDLPYMPTPFPHRRTLYLLASYSPRLSSPQTLKGKAREKKRNHNFFKDYIPQLLDFIPDTRTQTTERFKKKKAELSDPICATHASINIYIEKMK